MYVWPLISRGARLWLAALLSAGLLAALLVSVRGPVQAAPQAPTWTLQKPMGWITQVPFSVSVVVTVPTPILPDSVAYQTSTDGGNQWSSWRVDGLQVNLPVSTVAYITVTQLTFPDAVDTNVIRWRIATEDAVVHESPPFILPVDTSPPTITVTEPAAGSVITDIRPSGEARDAK